MKKSRLLGTAYACLFAPFATTLNAALTDTNAPVGGEFLFMRQLVSA